MKFYMAPLEGITGYIFRNALNEFFGEGIDKYYAPFIMPHVKRAFSAKELSELSPDNNQGIRLVPQILTDNADDFTRVKEEIRELGYDEVNLNLGCPSGTVTSKGRGAAMLEDIGKLDAFLDKIYEKGDENISVKTRIGISEPDEFEKIIQVYIKHPIKELIIHPRVMEQMYRGKADITVFTSILDTYKGALCYNGDICSIEDYVNLKNALQSACGIDRARDINIMIGRGMLKNPSLIRELNGGKRADREELYGMLSRLKRDYSTVFSGQTPVLFKLKEIWSYLMADFPEEEKLCKKIMKSKNLDEYEIYVKRILN